MNRSAVSAKSCFGYWDWGVFWAFENFRIFFPSSVKSVTGISLRIVRVMSALVFKRSFYNINFADLWALEVSESLIVFIPWLDLFLIWRVGDLFCCCCYCGLIVWSYLKCFFSLLIFFFASLLLGHIISKSFCLFICLFRGGNWLLLLKQGFM